MNFRYESGVRERRDSELLPACARPLLLVDPRTVVHRVVLGRVDYVVAASCRSPGPGIGLVYQSTTTRGIPPLSKTVQSRQRAVHRPIGLSSQAWPGARFSTPF